MNRLLPANENTGDRVVRIVLGLGLLSLYFLGPKTAWGLAGLIPILTSVLGSCPIYTLIGISTATGASQK
jgi:hypothetical protein